MSSEKMSTQEKILTSCWRLLESGEGSAVRMSDIAKAAGISRQAVYLHFPTRAELLIATTRYIDQIKQVDALLADSRNPTDGVDRLKKFIKAWGNYIPEIYGVAKALLAMKDSDAEAAEAWSDRMEAVRHGCAAVVTALRADRTLRPGLSEKDAIALLATLLSVRNWEQLTGDYGWSQRKYIERMTDTAMRALVEGAA